MKTKYYVVQMYSINTGDMIYNKFNIQEQFLVLDSTIDLTLLEINTGKILKPTPLDLVHNYLKLEQDEETSLQGR